MSQHRHRPFTPPKIVSIPLPKAESHPQFELGKVVMTPGALDLLRAKGLQPLDFLLMHEFGEWGEVDAEDRAANDAAVKNGARIFSAYRLGADRLWIITEACGDDGQRASTCLLCPEEY